MPKPTPVPVDERVIKFQSAEFRRATDRQVAAPGPVKAATTVHGRLLTRALASAVLVLLLLAGTAAGVYLASRDHPATSAAPPAPGTPAATVGAPSSTASPTASASPSVSLPPLDDDQIRLTVPAWPTGAGQGCASGLTTFTDFRAAASATSPSPVDVRGTLDVDVDHDGSAERLYLLRCDSGAADPEQVVAYHASTTRSFDFFGMVAQTGAPSGAGDAPAFLDIQALAAGPAGVVQLTVADRGSGGPAQQAVVQVRTFSWSGATFQQTSGPTTFQADSSQSRVSMSTEGDSQTLRIRLTNDGPGAAGLLLYVEVPAAPPAGGDWSRCEAYHSVPGGVSWTMCAVTLRAGVSTTFTLPVTASGSNPTARVQIRTGDNHFLYAEQTQPLATS